MDGQPAQKRNRVVLVWGNLVGLLADFDTSLRRD
jgi:hypothetical protein